MGNLCVQIRNSCPTNGSGLSIPLPHHGVNKDHSFALFAFRCRDLHGLTANFVELADAMLQGLCTNLSTFHLSVASTDVGTFAVSLWTVKDMEPQK